MSSYRISYNRLFPFHIGVLCPSPMSSMISSTKCFATSPPLINSQLSILHWPPCNSLQIQKLWNQNLQWAKAGQRAFLQASAAFNLITQNAAPNPALSSTVVPQWHFPIIGLQKNHKIRLWVWKWTLRFTLSSETLQRESLLQIQFFFPSLAKRILLL